MKSLIVQNSSTALREPDLFVGQKTLEQVDQVLDKYPDVPYGIIRCGLKFICNTLLDIILKTFLGTKYRNQFLMIKQKGKNLNAT